MLHRLNRLIFRGIILVLVKLFTRTKVSGLENIPTEGGVLMTANHLSVVDPALVFMSLDRQDATGFVAKKHQSNLFYRTIVNLVDGIWLNRYEADSQALRKARAYLKNGGIFGIAPEGTRSSTGALIPGKIGSAYLADIAQVPVQPVAIYGTEGAVHRLLRLERPRLHISFGELYTLPTIERKDRDAQLQRNTDEIMCRIAAMLPQKYRGVYVDYPRVQELLDSAKSQSEVFHSFP